MSGAQPEHATARVDGSPTLNDERSELSGEFLRVLAHDLANLTTPVQMGARLLQLSGGDQDVVRQVRDMLDETVAEMSRFVDQLRNAGHVAQDYLALRLARVDLRSIVERAVDAAKARVEAKQHSLDVTLPEQPCIVQADAERLSAAAVELLHNAAHFTPTGGSIQLQVQHGDGTAAIRVSDNGVGIASESLEHVTELFGKDHSQGDLLFNRRGIGLAMVRLVAERHGGSLQVISPGRDQGTTVVLGLPADGRL